MLQRFFGLRRKATEEEAAADDDDYVLLGDSLGGGDQSYTLEGATAFTPQGTRPPTAVTVRSFSHEDPLEGIPFQVNIKMSDEVPECHLSEAIAVVTRMEATDWDEYQYNFKLEQSVLHELSTNSE